MSVAELIEELRKMNQTAPVFIRSGIEPLRAEGILDRTAPVDGLIWEGRCVVIE